MEVIIARSDVAKGHPDHYQDMAQSLAEKTPNSFLANQFDNPANALAHYTTTGPEIWEQTNGQVDAVVAGVGSGGTVAGLAKFFKEKSPHIDIVVADPVGSIMADAVKTGEYDNELSFFLADILMHTIKLCIILALRYRLFRTSNRQIMSFLYPRLADPYSLSREDLKFLVCWIYEFGASHYLPIASSSSLFPMIKSFFVLIT